MILGIETSCDETAAALVQEGSALISSAVASSEEMHKKTNGIVPEVAAREQVRSMMPVIDEAMRGYTPDDIDAIAVTAGPGLIGSLLVGVHTAQTLSKVWEKPLIPVNHVLAHVYANWIGEVDEVPEFPAIALIVSGGHTEILYMTGHGQYEWLGGTRDDAVGEAFDKVARLLELGYPGGPVIQNAAESGDSLAVSLPRPMMHSDDFDFSFSGLKTAVMNVVRGEEGFNAADLAASFQEAAVEVLVSKTLRAAEEKQVSSILLAGGVAANQHLRELLVNNAGNGVTVHVPPLSLCMDNAAMIASCAYFNNNPVSWKEIKANPNLRL